jgi:hypothetical protein
VADGEHDTDVIVSGREPRERARRPPGLAWLLAGGLAALAAAVAVAVHHRAEAGAVRHDARTAAGRTGTSQLVSSLPQVTSKTLRLAAPGGVAGTADLVGYAWTGTVADRYWMTLDPAPGQPPGLHGQFAQGRAASFPAGQAPGTGR